MNIKTGLFLLILIGIAVMTGFSGSLQINKASANASIPNSWLSSGYQDEPSSMVASPALGSIAYYPISENRLALIDTASYTVTDMVDLNPYGCEGPRGLELNPDGTELYILCDSSESIVILNTADNSFVAKIERYHTQIQDITFVRGGEYALAIGENYTVPPDDIDVIDTSSHTVIQSIPVSGYHLKSITAHPYLPLAYAGGMLSPYIGGVLVINTDTFTVQTIIPYSNGVGGIKTSPDGHWLYASALYNPQGVAKIDLSINEVVDILPNFGRAGMSISPDSSTLFAGQFWGSGIVVIDTDTLDYLTTIPTATASDGSALTCNGDELYIPLSSDQIRVVDTQTYSIAHIIQLPGAGSNYEIALCPRQLNDIFTRLSANKSKAPPGTILDYTITFANHRFEDFDQVVITNTLPVTLAYQEGSLNAENGVYGFENGNIYWSGAIAAGQSVTITYKAAIPLSAQIGSSITNAMVITADGEHYTRRDTTEVLNHHVYLPCQNRPCPPLYSDNFSDPESGWPIFDNGNYKLDYVKGEYQILVRPPNNWVFAYGTTGYSDYHLEVDARPATQLDGAMGLTFSICDSGFYFFEIRDGTFSLRRNIAYELTWVWIIPWTRSSAINPGFQTNHLEVERQGYSIKLYANNRIIGDVSDFYYTCDGVGMLSEAMSPNFDGRFDNFTIYAGPCTNELMVDFLQGFDLFSLDRLMNENTGSRIRSQ